MLNVGIFGDNAFADTFGKKGTTNDIAIRNHKSSEGTFIYVHPDSDKIQSLMQSLNMIDIPVIVADRLTAELGEIMIAVDEMKFDKGFVIAGDEDAVRGMVKGTSMERFEFVTRDELRERLIVLTVERDSEGLEIPVDNYFNVKGVGTVALCIVKRGTIKVHDKVTLEPLGKDVVIKGIQVQDDFIDEAPAGTRVGLNLKGIESEELRRGYVLCRDMEKSKHIEVKFRKNRFCTEDISSGTQVMVSGGLQVVTFKILSSDGDILKLESEHDMVYRTGQRCVILSINSKLPRIMGSGAILNGTE